MKLKRLFLPAFLGLLFSGCVSSYKVVVEFSPELVEQFAGFPTIEADIAAVTDAEADDVKQAGVEKYFAPNSGMREKLKSQTCYFYRENQGIFVLPSRAPVWQDWALKQPTTLLIIASLPHDPAMSKEADPRILTVKMAGSYVFARTVYFSVEPKKVVQVAGTTTNKTDEKETQPSGQWVEAR